MKKLIVAAIISGALTIIQLIAVIRLAILGARIPDMESSSVAIIGGADGPTAIFLTSKITTFAIIARYAFLALCVVTLAVSIILLIKNRNKE